MFSKALISAAVAMSATANAFQQNNFANNQCGMKCCGMDNRDHMDVGDSMDDAEIPDSLKEFADNFDNEKCGMFCQMQTAFNDTLNAAMGGNVDCCEDDCCRMPPTNDDMCCSGGTCCAPPTTMSSSAQMEPLPEDFEFEQCGMMCQLNNTISDFASQAWNGTAVDATMAVSDSSDSDL